MLWKECRAKCHFLGICFVSPKWVSLGTAWYVFRTRCWRQIYSNSEVWKLCKNCETLHQVFQLVKKNLPSLITYLHYLFSTMTWKKKKWCKTKQWSTRVSAGALRCWCSSSHVFSWIALFESILVSFTKYEQFCKKTCLVDKQTSLTIKQMNDSSFSTIKSRSYSEQLWQNNSIFSLHNRVKISFVCWLRYFWRLLKNDILNIYFPSSVSDKSSLS